MRKFSMPFFVVCTGLITASELGFYQDENFGADGHERLRQKRAHGLLVKGVNSVGRLLSAADQVPSADKYTRLFKKTGTYDTAVNDFRSVNPVKVSQLMLPDGNKVTFGEAAYRTVMLEKRGDGGKPTLQLLRFTGRAGDMEKKMVYTDKIVYDPDFKTANSNWFSKWFRPK